MVRTSFFPSRLLRFYYQCVCSFRKTKRNGPDYGRNLDHQRPILDGQSSPSEGSSAFIHQNGAQQANLDGGQGMQYHTSIQEFHNMTARPGNQYSDLAQMQDGALHAPLDGGQPMQYQPASQDSHNTNPRLGHRYSHLRQDSFGGHGIAVPMRPLSTTTEQGYYYPQPMTGQYQGHAEVQDSRW